MGVLRVFVCAGIALGRGVGMQQLPLVVFTERPNRNVLLFKAPSHAFV
jgi:hypothetical protein